jgi:hypothetical protein
VQRYSSDAAAGAWRIRVDVLGRKFWTITSHVAWSGVAGGDGPKRVETVLT